MMIPVWNVHGDRATYQARPDIPRVRDGKPLKYETVAGDRMTLDVPRAIRGQLGNPAIPLFITEGARKADAGVSSGLCCVALLGVWNWRGTNSWGGKTALPDWELIACKGVGDVGREIYIVFDSDAMVKLSVFLALTRLKPFLESRGAVVRAIYLPAGEGGTKVGLDDFLAVGHDIDDLLALATDTLREPSDVPGWESEERESQADALVRIGSAGMLFSDPLGAAYVRMIVDDHRECWPLRSKGFRRRLTGAYFAETGRAPNGEAITNALNVLEARAVFGGTFEMAYVRIAPDGADGLYLDMGDPAWRVIHVTPAGWQMLADAPVNFVRAAGALALPEPIGGGRLDDLRRFVNITDENWPLLKAFLRGCLNPRGPYPLLSLNGEQGSAKSTAARMIRSLLDPRTPELRAEPREIRDLAIAARGSWLVVFDNISRLPHWLSDALCRLATGGGFATRELYTDFDEALFDAMRPVVLTGITDYVVKDDLLDRTIQVTLSAIPPNARRPEKVLWADFDAAQARLLGALLDDVSAALRALPCVQLERLPRLADFALWGTAAERGRGEPDLFMAAFAKARVASHEQAIESSPIGGVLLAFIAEDLAREPWQGIAKDLLARLAVLGGDAATRQKEWPKTPRGLSGMLRGLAPALRATGIETTFDLRDGKNRTRLIRLERTDSGAPQDGVPGPSASSVPPDQDASQEYRASSGADRPTHEADGWTASADGCSGDADGADGCAATVSVGVGGAQSDEWGEV